MNVLLVEPKFPKIGKWRNRHIPIGLLKLGAFYQKNDHKVFLARGLLAGTEIPFIPDEIDITSEYTYWSKYVKEAVEYYRREYSNAKIVVGGIYATLMPSHCKDYTGCDDVFVGKHEEAEKCIPLYELLGEQDIDTQIIHSTKGCVKRCPYCGAWRISSTFKGKKSIIDEIIKENIIFYDDNFLANPHVEHILNELKILKEDRKIIHCESQCGFDGDILLKKPYLAKKLKKAGFVYPKVAWDRKFDEFPKIKEQIDLLLAAKFSFDEISIFMLYNYDVPFEEMEEKRKKCWEWKVQITDCRYRPLEQTYDNYNGQRKSQKEEQYYIHKKSGWTDYKVRKFRENIRRQNICIRYRLPFYSKTFERRRAGLDIVNLFKSLLTKREKVNFLQELDIDYWLPNRNSL